MKFPSIWNFQRHRCPLLYSYLGHLLVNTHINIYTQLYIYINKWPVNLQIGVPPQEPNNRVPKNKKNTHIHTGGSARRRKGKRVCARRWKGAESFDFWSEDSSRQKSKNEVLRISFGNAPKIQKCAKRGKWGLYRMNGSCHVWMGRVTYEWAVSRMNGPCHVWMGRVQYEWVVSHECVTFHRNGSCPILMCHVPYGWVIYRVWRSLVPYEWVSRMNTSFLFLSF